MSSRASMVGALCQIFSTSRWVRRVVMWSVANEPDSEAAPAATYFKCALRQALTISGMGGAPVQLPPFAHVPARLSPTPAQPPFTPTHVCHVTRAVCGV